MTNTNLSFRLIAPQLLLCSLIVLVSPLSFAQPQQALVPGGIALLKLKNYHPDTKVYFRHKRVAVFPQKNATETNWIAMAGIGLSTKPGFYTFSVKPRQGKIINTKVKINSKKYEEQHLVIKNKRKVNPLKRDNKRIAKESIRKRHARQLYSSKPAQINFIWPITGRISSIFGLRRFFNEQERRPHSGLDIAMPEGTPIKAAADGKVIDAGNFFFSGNMIYLDHGQGIVTLYAHLSKINVKVGDTIKQGDIIGLVGQTGRVTGPHLHFAVYANQTLIDPIFMLPKAGNNYAATVDDQQVGNQQSQP